MAKARKVARKTGGWTPVKRSAASRKAWVTRKRNAGVKPGKTSAPVVQRPAADNGEWPASFYGKRPTRTIDQMFAKW